MTETKRIETSRPEDNIVKDESFFLIGEKSRTERIETNRTKDKNRKTRKKIGQNTKTERTEINITKKKE